MSFFKRNVIIQSNPIILKAIRGEMSNECFATLKEYKEQKRLKEDGQISSMNLEEHWFIDDDTVILGVGRLSKNRQTAEYEGCRARYKISLKEIDFGKKDIVKSAKLIIKAFRPTGGLHIDYNHHSELVLKDYYKRNHKIHIYSKKDIREICVPVHKGYIYIGDGINYKKIDFPLDKPLGMGYQNTSEYGYLGSIEVDIEETLQNIISENKKYLYVDLEVEKGVYWDVDRIKIDNIFIKKMEYKTWFVAILTLIIGGFISYLIGKFMDIYVMNKICTLIKILKK